MQKRNSSAGLSVAFLTVLLAVFLVSKSIKNALKKNSIIFLVFVSNAKIRLRHCI
jgi:hypothetical protein